MKTVTFTVSGMTCQACVKRVQTALQPLAEAVTVNLSPPQAIVRSPKVSDVQLINALAGSHYALSPDPLTANDNAAAQKTWLQAYQPLLLIVGYIAIASVVVQIPLGAITWHETMRYFMAGFFLTFSLFKMLDVKAFAQAYAGYDLLAASWKPWGYIYPFVELVLGLAYLANWQPNLTNAATLVVMGVSAVGVIRAVLNKQTIRCACLGSVFELPMSTVTIIEDLAMVAMAAFMLAAV
jgi:copper chaperone CopZ